VENRPVPQAHPAARNILSLNITRETWNEWLDRAENIKKETCANNQSTAKRFS
jgi:hypothetical protein